MNGVSTSLDTGTNGLEFIIAMTSAIMAANTSCVRFPCLVSVSIAPRMRRAMPIILSQLPDNALFLQKRLHSAVFNIHYVHVAAPTKFVPLSDLNSETTPRIATNRLMALTNEEEVIYSMTALLYNSPAF